MKNLLLLAFYFVPRNHIASYRSGCFAKYLPENGWRPTVICTDWPAGSPDYDPEFVGVMPDEVKIFRVPNAKPQGFYQKVIVRKLFPYLWPHRSPILWWKRAHAQMESLLAQQKFDAVWATSDPMVPLALAEDASKMAGIPWVADIRDSFNAQIFGSWYKRPFFAHQERRLCRSANHVVAVSNGLAEALQPRIGKAVQVITNGFDPALFSEPVQPDTTRFRIAYAGSLVWPHRNPAPVLQALALCLDRGWIPRANIEITFHGSSPQIVDRCYPGAAEKLPVRLLPRVSHHEVIRIQKSSAALLLLTHPGEKGVLTGKLFDYLASGRPILAVPDDQDEVSAVLRRTGAGVSLTKVEDIARQITAWYQLWKSGAPLQAGRDENEIARYSRRQHAATLAATLNEITHS